jgi:hypothetical protein
MTAGTFLQVEGEGDAGSPLATVPKALPIDGITRPGDESAVAVGPDDNNHQIAGALGAMSLDRKAASGGATASASSSASVATAVAPTTSWVHFDHDGLRISARLPDDGGHFSHR